MNAETRIARDFSGRRLLASSRSSRAARIQPPQGGWTEPPANFPALSSRMVALGPGRRPRIDVQTRSGGADRATPHFWLRNGRAQSKMAAPLLFRLHDRERTPAALLIAAQAYDRVPAARFLVGGAFSFTLAGSFSRMQPSPLPGSPHSRAERAI
jgi:hypothetical protein